MGRRRTAAAQAGTEIVQSYFPLNLHYSERQQRTRDLYGFVRPALSGIMSRCPPCSLIPAESLVETRPWAVVVVIRK